MIGVVFVCHGNICRSPMAEFVFKDLVNKRGLEKLFHIESRATYRDVLGSCPHEGTRKKLAEHDIDCGGKRAELLSKEDRDFDYIIGMDSANLVRMRHILGECAKMYKLLDFTSRPKDIADPWYTGDFEATYRDVYEGSLGLLEYIVNHNLNKQKD